MIPQVSLQELVRLEGEAVRKTIEKTAGIPVFRRRGRLLPLVYMNEVLGSCPSGSNQDQLVANIVVLHAEEGQFGLVVDTVLDTQEIVLRRPRIRAIVAGEPGSA